MGGGARCEVAARGEPHNPDTVRRDVPLAGFGANRADRALRVAQFDRMVVTRPEPVLQHERGDAE